MTIGNAVLLVDAIQKGDTNQVKDLLGKGIDINMRDTEDRTLLHYAVWYNNPEVLKLLLDKNPDIEAKDSAGRTPLYAAVHSVMVNHANLDLVKFLLNKGANTEVGFTHNYYTPLYHAVKSGGSYGLVKELLDNGANPDLRDNYNYSPLHYAAQEGRIDVVELLLDKGADIEAYTKHYKSPLSIAIEGKYVDLAKVLIDRGGNITVKEKNIMITLSKDNNTEQIVDFLKNRVIYTPLHYAAREGKKDLIIRLLNKGNDINAKDTNGRMPLHYAAWSGQLDAARVLVDRGANIGARDKNGKTALDLANIPKKSEIANFLKAKQSEYDNKLLAAMHRSKRQIYTPSVDKQIFSLEAQGYALEIVDKFESIMKQAAPRCGISVQQLKVDSQEIQSSILKKIMTGDYRGASGVLYSAAEKACPALEQKKKFSMYFKGKVEQMLQKEMMPLLDKANVDSSSVSTNKAVAVALSDPRTNLNNVSITSNSNELIR